MSPSCQQLGFLLLFSCGMFSCGQEQSYAMQMDALEAKVAELNRQVVTTNVRLEDMNNRLIILQDKLTVMKTHQDGKEAIPVLRKVKLVPGKDEPGPQADASLTQSEKNATNTVLGTPLPMARQHGMIARYDEALAAFKADHHDVAIALFSEFKKDFPHTDYTDNAVFWLGMSRFRKGEYRLALARFAEVLDYASSNKKADALYYIGKCHQALGNDQTARTVWKQLMERYPNSDAARSARQELS